MLHCNGTSVQVLMLLAVPFTTARPAGITSRALIPANGITRYLAHPAAKFSQTGCGLYLFHWWIQMFHAPAVNMVHLRLNAGFNPFFRQAWNLPNDMVARRVAGLARCDG